MDNNNNEGAKPDYATFVRALCKSGATIASALTPSDAHLLHMAVGVSGEVAELMDTVQQHTEFDHQLNVENLKEELGDLLFYLKGIEQGLHVTEAELEDVMMFGCTPVVMRTEFRACAMSLTVAAGDLLDVAKRVTIYRKALDRPRALRALEELYENLSRLASYAGLCRVDIIDANIAKLSVRYSELRYTDVAAQTRADKVVAPPAHVREHLTCIAELPATSPALQPSTHPPTYMDLIKLLDTWARYYDVQGDLSPETMATLALQTRRAVGCPAPFSGDGPGPQYSPTYPEERRSALSRAFMVPYGMPKVLHGGADVSNG